MLVVAKTMKNPRSALCKTSIMAAADIFNAFGDKLLEPSTSDDAFDGLVLWTQLSFRLCVFSILLACDVLINWLDCVWLNFSTAAAAAAESISG